VKLEITVAGSGRVAKVAHKDGDKAPVACLTAAVKAIAFARSVNGGRFPYSFAFGTVAQGEALDRVAISEGVAKVKSAITACGTSTVKGIVKVRVIVAPSGAVTNAEIDRTPDAALGACVAAAMTKATFKPTKTGGSFSYPFVF
jgi:TonB family protein